MPDADLVLTILSEISAKRGGSFAIVHADLERNCYTQFRAEGDSGLYVEVVGNAFLASADRLTRRQQDEMRARGWTMEPGSNWSQRWADDSSDDARARIAFAALGALREVYGATGDVEIEVQIEGGEGPASDAREPASESPDPPAKSERGRGFWRCWLRCSPSRLPCSSMPRRDRRAQGRS